MRRLLLGPSAAGALLALSGAMFAANGHAAATPSFDEAKAKALFKRNDCGKCHAPDRDKKGPALQKIAKEMKGKPDAEDKLVKQLTSSPKVKLLDSGKEEEHKAVDTKDVKEIKNLVAWILAQ
jgi:cytochrome c